MDQGTAKQARYSHRLDDGRVECTVCPRLCKLRDGEIGACRVRGCQDGLIVPVTKQRRGPLRVEPVEAKGLAHFLPGTLTLSAGRFATNLAARFQVNGAQDCMPGADLLASPGMPNEIARCAREQACPSLVLDGGEPAVAIEDAIELAEACRELGLKSVVLTRGYLCPGPRAELYRHVDAVRVELFSIRERFYWKFCGGHIAPVLDTLAWLAQRTPVWLEIGVPLVPGENDSIGEVDQLTRWIGARLGPDIPLHFTISHLKPSSWVGSLTPPPAKMTRACQIARANGLRYVYTDDLFDPATRGTFCHECGELLIGRDWYLVTEWNLTSQNRCAACGAPCSGSFHGRPGAWRDGLWAERQEARQEVHPLPADRGKISGIGRGKPVASGRPYTAARTSPKTKWTCVRRHSTDDSS
jgi:pyruvate formate lyase activating enzyme